MIRFFLALILALDTALFTALLFLVFWSVRKRAIRRQAVNLVLNLPNGVAIASDRDGALIMNHQAKELFNGLHKENSKRLEDKLPLFDHTGKPLHAKDHPLLRSLHLKRSVEQVKRWIRNNDGRLVPVAVSAAYIPVVRDEPFAAMLIRDISREELIETMKRDFIGIASHQLRSPLASLKWYGEILTRNARSTLKSVDQEYLDRMNDATERMISLVDDFLNVSKFETDTQITHTDQIRLSELIDHIIEVHRPIIKEKNLSVRVFHSKILKPIFADPAMLREALANFIANAVKYNRNGGKVSIRVGMSGNFVEIRVSDTGVGIPKDQQERVFSKFFRADNAVTQGYKGTGLGLYTAKLILEQMKGVVRFESEQGKGTTFWIRFPRDQRKNHKK